MFINSVQFNGLSSEIYRNGMPHSELNILAKIQLGLISRFLQAWLHMMYMCGIKSLVQFVTSHFI